MANAPLRPYCECTSCCEPMTGIYSYSIREVCTPCGGQAKASAAEYRRQNEEQGRLPARGTSKR